MALQLFKIAETTVATPQSSIDFTSIPQGYTDLAVLISPRGTADSDLVFTVNGSTTSYSNRNLYGVGTTAGSYSNNYTNKGYIAAQNGPSRTANTFGSVLLYCPNYAGSNNKSFNIDSVMEGNSTTDVYLILDATLWSNTSAITSISIFYNSGNLVSQSTATLYGIL
jgi:hypothetical protein